MCDATVFVNSS